MAASAPLVALTGATGFLGRHLAAALAGAGCRLRLLVRQDPAHPLLDGVRPELVMGDLSGAAVLERFTAGADIVIHAAGLIKARDRAAFYAVNADGSARLGRAVAATAPGARLLVVSSQAASQPALSDYAGSKRAGEAAAIAGFGGADWLVVRPPALYGPWDRETLALFKAVSGPLVPVLGRADARIAMMHVGDAAAAITALAMTGDGVRGATYSLCDGRHDGYGWDEILDHAGAAVGRTPPRLRIPYPLLALAGLGGAIMATLRRRPIMLVPGKVREITHPDWRVDPAAMPPPALWQPRIGLADGFAATADWYRSQGWI